MVNPLITCIMPTTASRNKYLPCVLECFFNQSHRNKELVIVCEDYISDLIPIDPRIKIIWCERGLSIGRKRILASEHATGEYVAHWDSDDWSHSDRLSTQLAFMTAH